MYVFDYQTWIWIAVALKYEGIVSWLGLKMNEGKLKKWSGPVTSTWSPIIP